MDVGLLDHYGLTLNNGLTLNKRYNEKVIKANKLVDIYNKRVHQLKNYDAQLAYQKHMLDTIQNTLK